MDKHQWLPEELEAQIGTPYAYNSKDEWCEFCKSYECKNPNYWPSENPPWSWLMEMAENPPRY